MYLSNISKNKIIVYVVCIMISVIHWLIFSRYGNISWKTFDWLGSFPSFDILKQSFNLSKIPFHSTGYGSLISHIKLSDIAQIDDALPYGVRNFSNGFTFVSPQIFLLSFLSVEDFITFNFIFYNMVGIYGIYKLSEEFNLSIFSIIFLFIVLNFNGAVVSRMGIGNMYYCNAYMYIPLYLWLLYKFIQIRNNSWLVNSKYAILFSLLIFFTKLNANGQNTYQFLFVGLLVVLFYPKKILWYFLSLILSFLLMSFYIVPTAMFSRYMNHDRIIFGGYGFQSGGERPPLIDHNSASNFLEKGLYHGINIVNHLWESLTVSYTAAYESSWEYGLYLGEFGSVIVLLSVAGLMFKNKKEFSIKKHRYLIPALIIALLSVSIFKRELINILELITSITTPKVDRFPSRLMIYPFSLALIFAAIGFDGLFTKIPEKLRSYVKCVVLLILFIILMQHSYGWSLAQTESHYILPPYEVRHLFNTVILDIEGDDYYKKVVNISYLVSFLSFLAIVSGYFHLRRKIDYSSKKNI